MHKYIHLQGFKKDGKRMVREVHALNPSTPWGFDGYALDEIHINAVVTDVREIDLLISTLTVARQGLHHRDFIRNSVVRFSDDPRETGQDPSFRNEDC